MQMFRSALLATLILCGGNIAAQGLDDALRFSRQQYHGSARFNAMGGAFTALGGDFGAAHLNPASTGVFTKNELGFSLGVGNTAHHAAYYGNSSTATYGKANVNNMGLVFTGKLNESEWKTLNGKINEPDWKMLNFAISFTRTHDFNQKISYSGTQNDHSYAQYVNGIANSAGLTPEGLFNSNFAEDVFITYPAWEAYVIDLVDNTDTQYYSAIASGETVEQQVDIERNGRGSEFMLSAGSNYKDRLYLGLGVKVGTLVFTESMRHTEIPEDQSRLEQHIYGTDLELRGTSISVSGGIIARLTKMFRLGLSVQTPNFYTQNEVFYTGFRSRIAGSYSEAAQSFQASGESPESRQRYNLNTPWRFTGGLAAVFGARAILSAEYEFQNFGSARFGRNNRSASNYDFSFENDEIEAVLGSAHNVRAGFEYRILPFSLRAGYAYMSNPVKPNFRSEANRDIHQISAGAGVKFGSVYLDASYFYRFTNSQYSVYDNQYLEPGVTVDPARLNIVQHGVALTVGVRY